MARAGAAPRPRTGRIKIALTGATNCWQRRDGVVHHCGVQIDLDTLPDDPVLLQQMLRDVVTVAAQQHGNCMPRTTNCAC